MTNEEFKELKALLSKIDYSNSKITELTKMLGINPPIKNDECGFSLTLTNNNGLWVTSYFEIPLEVRNQILHTLIAHYQKKVELDTNKVKSNVKSIKEEKE